MPLRTLVLLCLASLLVACSSEPPKSVQPQVLAQPKTDAPADLGPLPTYQRELSGVLTGVPAGAEVELAMLIIDERGRPQGLMASSKIAGNNQALPFKLRFNPEAFPAGARVELRGRASKSGQLILHLPSRIISQPTSQALGALAFVKAP
ncbi:MAG: hypothetical protein V4749_15065 [Pseudomonadota bacterium]